MGRTQALPGHDEAVGFEDPERSNVVELLGEGTLSAGGVGLLMVFCEDCLEKKQEVEAEIRCLTCPDQPAFHRCMCHTQKLISFFSASYVSHGEWSAGKDGGV
jgi:hypothetical protein